MIKLDKLITDVRTDTLFLTEARFDFETQTVFVTIKRGTTDNDGNFVENYSQLHITVAPDGSFASDGKFSGDPGTVPVAALVQSLQAALEGQVSAVLALY